MKSTISWFNSTLYRKTMARFWPMWGGYSLLLAFLLPLNLLNRYADYSSFVDYNVDQQSRMFYRIMEIPDLVPGFVMLLVAGAVLCAMAVFGYLYHNRSACMLHALPMRRETIFTTQYLAGLSFLLLPLLAVTAVTAGVEMIMLPTRQWGLALRALMAFALPVAGISFFFFSFAAFCAMFTGHILALPIFYGVLNGLAFALWVLVTSLMQLFFYGYYSNYDTKIIKWLTPVYQLMDKVHWHVEYQTTENGPAQVLRAWMEGTSVILIYSLVGLVFAVAALAVYRRRHIETAGDVVSVAMVRPVFRVGVSLCAGLFLGTLSAAFFSWNDKLLLCVLVVLWAVVGFFAAEMLLQKSFRVFHRWKGAVGMAAAMALLCCCFYFDWTGIQSYVPPADQVETLTVRAELGYPSDSGRWMDGAEIRDPRLIQEFLTLHQAILTDHDQRGDEPNSSYEEGTNIRLRYQMKNGRQVTRDYYPVRLRVGDLHQEGTPAAIYNRLVQDKELTAKYAYTFDQVEGGSLLEVGLENCTLSGSPSRGSTMMESLSGEQRRALWQAMRQDFEEGHLSRRSLFVTPELLDHMYATSIRFYWGFPQKEEEREQADLFTQDEVSYDRMISVMLTREAVHTLTLLRDYDIINESCGLTRLEYERSEEDPNIALEGDLVPAQLPPLPEA